MKKSLILLILPLLLAAGCGEDNTPVQVSQPLSPEDQMIANCHTVQQAVEAFAADNNGEYPADVESDTSLGGNTLIDLLPGGTLLENPFTKFPSEPVASTVAAWPGETAYAPTSQDNIVLDGYVITGYGESALIITLWK